MKTLPLLTLLLSATAVPVAIAAPAASSTTTPAAASTAGADNNNSGIIGRIGGIQVNAADVRSSLDALSSQDGAAVRNDPALLSQVVRSLLVQKVLLAEAEKQGHDKKPEVAAQLARAREVALTESYLQTVATPPANWPSEAELQAAYETAKPSIAVPKSWRLAQIFIALPKDADKAAAAKIQGKLDTVRKSLAASGADFAKLASDNSDDRNSAGRGGEIGWLAESQIQPGIREKLGALKVDAISEPVKLEDGWHFVKVLDAREPYTPALDQIRAQLVAQLRVEKTRANSQAYLAKLLQENPPAVNELALSQLAAEPKK